MNSKPPPKLSGKDFEELILDAGARSEKLEIFCIDRYGVEVSFFQGKPQAIPSKPDFEGTRADGRHFVIEAKVNSQATFQMSPEKIKPRQIKFMLKRSRFGSKCFLLIHWNERILVKSHDPAFTVAIPVNGEDPRWQKYVDDYAKAKREKKPMEIQPRISREEAVGIGTLIKWVIPDGCRKATPMLIPIIYPEFISIMLDEAQPESHIKS